MNMTRLASLRIALLSLALAFAAPLAYGQGGPGGSGSPQMSPSDVSDDQIESVARVVVALQQLQAQFRQQYGNPQNMDSTQVAQARRQMMQEQRRVMQEKAKEQGMTPQKVTQIIQVARQDSTLRTEMQAAIQKVQQEKQQEMQGGDSSGSGNSGNGN